MRSIGKFLLALVLFVSLIPSGAWAAGTCGWDDGVPIGADVTHCTGTSPWVADSLSALDVSYCINTCASNGDTVVLPVGSATWSTQVEMHKAIRLTGDPLLGGGGEAGTVITNNYGTNWRSVLASDCGTSIWHPNEDTNAGCVAGERRIDNFTINGRGSLGYSSTITIAGSGRVRVDHMSGSNVGTFLGIYHPLGSKYGVVDHCTFSAGLSNSEIIQINSKASDETAQWAALDSYEVESKSFYVEDNTFLKSVSGSVSGHAVAASYAGRVVFRYNHVEDMDFDAHGYCPDQPNIGTRLYEIYWNTFKVNSGKTLDRWIYLRGGSGVVYNNAMTVVGTLNTSVITLQDQQFGYSGCGCWAGSYPPPATHQIGTGQNNAIVPLYIWNNTVGGSVVGVEVDNGDGDCGAGKAAEFIQANRNYYLSAKPGYGDILTYPHSLVGDPGPDLSAPYRFDLGPTESPACVESTSATTLTITTTDATNPVTCKYCEDGVSACTSSTDYDTMANTFEHTAQTDGIHTQSKTGLSCSTHYIYHVRCADSATSPNKNTNSVDIDFWTATGSDPTPPTLSTAVLGIDGRTLTLAFDKTVKFGAGGSTGVTITPTGGAATIGYALGENSSVLVYHTSRFILPTETVTTAYTQPGNGIESAGGVDLVTFTPQATTNSSTFTTPGLITIWSTTYDVIGSGGGINGGDGRDLELGVKFQTSVSSKIQAIRFYKQASNTGTHIGNIWTTAGANLGTVTFTDETASGWQQMNFTTPIQVTAGTTYIASVFMPAGYWTVSNNYFAGKGVSNVVSLSANTSESVDRNGVYLYTSDASAFPSYSSLTNYNYWIDVVLEAFSTGVDVEAEDGVLSGMNTGTSGPITYIYTPTSSTGSASYLFNVTTAGVYYLETSVNSNNSEAQNSFYVGVDGESANLVESYAYHFAAAASGFVADNVSKVGTGSMAVPQLDPMVWTLTPGLHTFVIYGRESNAWLDKIKLTISSTATGGTIKLGPGTGGSAVTGGEGTIKIRQYWDDSRMTLYNW